MRVVSKQIILFLFFTMFSFDMFSMDGISPEDSISQMIRNPSIADTTKINRLLTASDLVVDKYPDEARSYGLKAVEMARKLNDTAVLYNVLSKVGFDEYSNGRFNNALNYFLEDERIALILNDSVKLAASSLNLGAVYDEMGDYQNTLDYYLRSLSLHDALHDSIGIAYCNVN